MNDHKKGRRHSYYGSLHLVESAAVGYWIILYDRCMKYIISLRHLARFRLLWSLKAAEQGLSGSQSIFDKGSINCYFTRHTHPPPSWSPFFGRIWHTYKCFFLQILNWTVVFLGAYQKLTNLPFDLLFFLQVF